MPDFPESRWTDKGFAQDYLEDAGVYIPFRSEMLRVAASLCSEFLAQCGKSQFLDLGCGDGIVTSVVAGVCPGASATLVDGSRDMLDKAELRFAERDDFSYVHASFKDLVRRGLLKDVYDLAISSLAVHHLSGVGKKALYRYIFNHLTNGGHLVNLDVVLAPDDDLERWYMKLWKEWIDRQRKQGITDKELSDIPLKYKNNPDNRPDTLDVQLAMLSEIGFEQVDCYYKYGAFAVFGGRKPE